MKEKKHSMQTHKKKFLLITLVPAFVFYFLFTLWPNIISVYYSLLNWNGISEPEFVGLKNFREMFHDKYFWNGLIICFKIFIVTVPVTMIIGLLLAFAITNTKSKLNGFYQSLFYFPNIVPVVVVALLWSFIYDGDIGLLNSFLGMFGDRFVGKYWLADKELAIYCIMAPMIWFGVGFHMIIYLNAMRSIPPSLYEVAILGGATPLQKLIYVTLPLIRKTLFVSATFLTLNAFKTFELVMLMTNGGPSSATNVLPMYMYNQSFGKNGISTMRYGYASAIGMALMVILIVIKVITDHVGNHDEVEF